MRFSSSSAQTDGGYVVRFEGQLELSEAGDIKALLFELIDAGASSITVDLTRADAVDETAIGIMILADKRLRRAGGRLEVIANGRTAEIERLLAGSRSDG